MITEDYVSFETAKLLKEKGFWKPDCKFAWIYTPNNTWSFISFGQEEWGRTEDDQWTLVRRSVGGYYLPSDVPNLIPSYTQSLTLKWLRVVHGIHVIIPIGFGYPVWYTYHIFKIKDSDFYYTPENDNFPTPEEATEEAIQYCLKELL